ncbi:MAG: hypothetical protein WCY88_00125 [Spongiibacteraceae bacterium]
MKLNNAIAMGETGAWKEAQIRANPGSRSQWFVTLYNDQNKSFILADNDDNPITVDDINVLTQLIKSIGLKELTIFL